MHFSSSAQNAVPPATTPSSHTEGDRTRMGLLAPPGELGPNPLPSPPHKPSFSALKVKCDGELGSDLGDLRSRAASAPSREALHEASDLSLPKDCPWAWGMGMRPRPASPPPREASHEATTDTADRDSDSASRVTSKPSPSCPRSDFPRSVALSGLHVPLQPEVNLAVPAAGGTWGRHGWLLAGPDFARCCAPALAGRRAAPEAPTPARGAAGPLPTLGRQVGPASAPEGALFAPGFSLCTPGAAALALDATLLATGGSWWFSRLPLLASRLSRPFAGADTGEAPLRRLLHRRDRPGESLQALLPAVAVVDCCTPAPTLLVPEQWVDARTQLGA
mmetsp:Transcript_82664/g.188924  ORF Transcript_82664/g.188924 Transcript_82664/m.188924 type:complete len:334 (+) Transcript_82664:729-1730(+)